MFDKIINITNKLISEKLKFRKISSVLFSPSLSEVRREFQDSPELRLIIDPRTQNYYVADANKFTHFDIMKEAGIVDLQNIEGGIYEDGYIWLRGHTIKKFFNNDLTPQEQLGWFKNTELYKNLSSLIEDIDIQNYFDWKQT